MPGFEKILVYKSAIKIILVSLALSSCQSLFDHTGDQLFTSLDTADTKVVFINQLEYKEKFNIYRYRNFYNGGGVALGDIDHDGLIDIYFTSNMHQNRLYRNLGNFHFQDITEQAGVGGNRSWSTGVSMADVNGDGWLDIYVCNSGDIQGDNKQNELFINRGDLTFSEEAEAYGIADQGFSTHGAFFDYDRDGDLDLYLLNNSYQAIGSFDLKQDLRNIRDEEGCDKLFRNDGQIFTDVSVSAGIYGSVIGFGLGVTVGDIDQDGWMDIYVSNDFFEKDYIYLNNHDGTFTENLEKMMPSISAASMGADMADINNDGYPEIFATDMIPEPDYRLKTKTTFDSWDNYQFRVKNGYYHQFTRNMLQLNNQDETFSEIGRLAGVYATDWSWGALIFDMDNDGLKDLFVANGIYQDLTDQDYIQYFSDVRVMRSIVMEKNVDFQRLIDAIPSEKIPNYAFRNEGGYHFENVADAWGLAAPSHSNGSAYGDLDNDGDLDIVVNNVNMPAFILRNNSIEKHPDNHYLKIILHGEGKNTYAFGSKIKVKYKNEISYIEQMPIRGFQSSVDPRPNFGLGNTCRVDTLIVEWPDGKVTMLTQVDADQTITLNQLEAGFSSMDLVKSKNHPNVLFQEILENKPIDFIHQENDFNDFNRDKLINHMISREGPRIAKADVNADGMEDIFIGGAKDRAGALYIQMKDGSFIPTNREVFEADKTCEDTDAAFFDADQDGDVDLYVTSGGYEFSSSSTALIDRLYLNDGNGNLSRSDQILPAGKFESTSCVRPADFDEDGDIELFVGVRLKPFLYGMPTSSYVLENDGLGRFSDISDEIAPGLKDIGMITDMVWADIDDDHDLDMVIVGEWMPITIFQNNHGQFENITEKAGLGKSNGWWNRIQAGDLDQDGDTDLVAGNHGWNSRFKASQEKPVTMYVNDYDMNGSVEQVICMYNGNGSYPVALKHDLVNQIPFLAEKYPRYEDYVEQTITDIFSSDQLKRAVVLEAFQLANSAILNHGDGTFEVKPLPVEAQFSPVYAIDLEDVDRDGVPDILMGGNFYAVKPEIGRYDASYGSFLKGNGKGSFTWIPPGKSGFRLNGEIRDLISLDMGTGKLMIVARNNSPLQIFKY